MKSNVMRVLTVAAGAIVVYTLYELRHALLLFYFASVLAVMFDPAVRLIERAAIGHWRPGRGIAVAAVCLLVAGVITLVLLLIVPPLMADAGRLESRWPQQAARVVEWMHAHLPFTSSVTVETLAARARAFAGRRPAVRLGASIVDVLTTLLMAIYLLIDGRDAVHWATSPIPEPHRTRARRVLVQGARRMQRWVRGQGLLMLLHGGSAFVTFQLIGLPYADALGVFAAIANVIPFLGPILTLMAAGLVAATEAPDKLLGVVVFYLAYHNTESAWLQPRIMSSAVGVPGLTVIAALVLGNEIAGLAGMVFSVPTAVLIAELMKA